MTIDRPPSINHDRSIAIAVHRSSSINLDRSIDGDRSAGENFPRRLTRKFGKWRGGGTWEREEGTTTHSPPPPHPVSRGRERRGGGRKSLPPSPRLTRKIPQGEEGSSAGGTTPQVSRGRGYPGRKSLLSPSPPTPRPPRLTRGEDIHRRGRLSTEKPPRWEREGPHPHGREGLTGPHPPPKVRGRWAPREEKQNNFFFLLIMIHLQMIISPSFLIRFGCFWDRWKALDE